MTKHKLTLLGGLPDELRISGAVLHETIGALIDGARLATRFAVEGESVRKGPRPAWLDAAGDFQITALTAGSAVLAMDAPALRDVDPARFGVGAQRSLFGGADERFGEQTGIDLFGQHLTTILEGDRDDVLADRALLDGCARFARVSGGGFSGLRLEGLRGRSSPLVITYEDASRIERLRDETPRPQAARVAGTLDTVSASRSDVMLTLKDGTRVPARMEEHDLEALRSLLGKEVVVSGMARYRPSGRLLLLDVEGLDVARPEDRVFQKAPVARKQKVAIEPAVPSESTGISAFFGTWPGDETDAELLEALRAIG
jgi:hypothetical protein